LRNRCSKTREGSKLEFVEGRCCICVSHSRLSSDPTLRNCVLGEVEEIQVECFKGRLYIYFCCSVLQCVAVVLQCVLQVWSILDCMSISVAVCCSVLQWCCSVCYMYGVYIITHNIYEVATISWLLTGLYITGLCCRILFLFKGSFAIETYNFSTGMEYTRCKDHDFFLEYTRLYIYFCCSVLQCVAVCCSGVAVCVTCMEYTRCKDHR